MPGPGETPVREHLGCGIRGHGGLRWVSGIDTSTAMPAQAGIQKDVRAAPVTVREVAPPNGRAGAIGSLHHVVDDVLEPAVGVGDLALAMFGRGIHRRQSAGTLDLLDHVTVF